MPRPPRGLACYILRMDALRNVLAEDPRIAYALVFGSTARGTAHAGSDLDIAVGLESSARLRALDLGDLIARLEHAGGDALAALAATRAPPSQEP